jgi:hypothetical protein
VKVGAQVAPLPDELSRWMARFDECPLQCFGRAERLVAIAAAHRRDGRSHPIHHHGLI